MSGSPYFSSTAASTPYKQESTKLGVIDVQQAIDKLAWLMSASQLVDEDGNFIIKLGTPIEKIVIASDIKGTSYYLTVSDGGELITDSSYIPITVVQNFRLFKKPDGAFARISVEDDGVAAVIDADSDPYTASLQSNTKAFLKSPNGTVWLFGITSLNEVFLETGTVGEGTFKIINQEEKLLFGVTSQGTHGLNYLPIFNKNNLPPTPITHNNSLPWSFLLDDRGNKVPIFFDGTAWRYFSNNELIDA